MSQAQQHFGRAEAQPKRADLCMESEPYPHDSVFEGGAMAVADRTLAPFSPQPAGASVGPGSVAEAVAAGVAAHRRGAAVIVAESLARYPDLALRIVMACIKRAPSAAGDVLAGARQSGAWGAVSTLP